MGTPLLSQIYCKYHTPTWQWKDFTQGVYCYACCLVGLMVITKEPHETGQWAVCSTRAIHGLINPVLLYSVLAQNENELVFECISTCYSILQNLLLKKFEWWWWSNCWFFRYIYLGVLQLKKVRNFGIFLSQVTNSENSFDLIAFCGATVSRKDVFLCEFKLWEANCIIKLALSSEGFMVVFGHFQLSVWLFQQFSWPFSPFFTEGLAFFEKRNMATLVERLRLAE